MGVRTAGRVLLYGLCFAAAAAAADPETARKELASTGRLRVGIASAPKPTAFFVVVDAGGKPHGVTAELGNELARTLGVRSEFLITDNSGEITDALEKGLIDVAFLPVDEERRKRVDFGPMYVLFESTCLVLGGSGFRTVADLDRPGVRVGGEADTTTLRAAARALRSATIVAVPSVGEGIAMLRSGQIEAFALGREGLVPYQAEIPGSRILDGYFHRTGVAIAVQKNHKAALAHARAFLEDAKASGLIRRVLDQTGLRSTAVAPAE
jgi:polar amino acid transport system substrate-binding protein